MRSARKYKQQVYFEQPVLTKELHNLAGYFPPLKSKMTELCRRLNLIATLFWSDLPGD